MEIRCYDLKASPCDFLNVIKKEPGAFLLESSLFNLERGRYSFLGFDPFLTVKGNDLRAFKNLEKTYQRFVHPVKNCGTPFLSGIVGYLSYDFGLQFEKIKSRFGPSGLPGFYFGFYDCVMTIDHYQKKLLVSSSGLPQTTTASRKKRALSRLQRIEKMIESLSPAPNPYVPNARKPLYFQSHFSKSAYCNAVKKALDYIKLGDIYQVNLAQEFSCRFNAPVDAPNLYAALRGLSASSFGGYLDCGRSQIVSSSPELFLRLQNGCVQTRPMKGTRPRGNTLLEDRQKKLELRRSAKEKAELLMVTDLERNDLGRVCDFGSVKVKRVREIEKYRTVYQATSTVTGHLAKGKSGFDLIRNCFPGGSISGCPKIRAMEIINELEPSARGIYTGALGYMDFGGDLVFNVLIRTMLVKGRKVSFHVGSGIVADSKPQAEYEETLVKAQALKESLHYENANNLS